MEFLRHAVQAAGKERLVDPVNDQILEDAGRARVRSRLKAQRRLHIAVREDAAGVGQRDDRELPQLGGLLRRQRWIYIRVSSIVLPGACRKEAQQAVVRRTRVVLRQLGQSDDVRRGSQA